MLSDDQIIGTIVECLQQRFYEHELITVLLFCYTLLRKFAKNFTVALLSVYYEAPDFLNEYEVGCISSRVLRPHGRC